MTAAALILEDTLTRLVLRPDLGGSIANWSLRNSGLPLLRHADRTALEAATPRRLGCFPLLPWSNRIDQGGFANPDAWLDLTPNSDDPYPIHGTAWQQAWSVVEQSRQQVLLRLDSEEPFAYSAEQRIHLDGGRLSIELQVTHRAAAPAWYGLGLHPYFPRTANTQLHAPAAGVWQGVGAALPSELTPLPSGWDFHGLQRLPAERVDHAFSGWNGQCRIHQPDLGYDLDCSASHCAYYLLFTPPGQGFFCIEPVSHPINAHHLPGRPGLRLLTAGQTARLNWHMACRLLD
ncbi:aldose 1-epimerase [Aquipseudomonas ullengensis]|uniref:Aldose 1-epimerase n=1 Tax=Aquipseudomonas ullengensis TaxID=2759166 RepID=A0A7W4LJ48_9GAMM|nr:aldose 1-epimerase [Pseudomonas ullengensis]MBB2493987.1 aldose 1-epimerase [Pseudomonas ullengensis]